MKGKKRLALGRALKAELAKLAKLDEKFAKRHFLRIAFSGLPAYTVPVEFADDASRIFCEIRDDNGFGASDMKTGCGDLLDAAQKIVGHISYNGRIWDAEGKEVF